MQTFLIYILKATVYSGILFSYYVVALRNKRFHYYNRFYLLMSVVMSLLLPFLTIELWQWQSNNQQVIQLMNVVVTNKGETDSLANSNLLSRNIFVMLTYGFITLCLLLAFATTIFRIFRYKRSYPVEKLSNISFINTNLEQAPFSFFNNLFWKDTIDISDATGRQIFKHELTHIEQKHSWDKVFLRLTTLFFWINPFYWLIEKELGLIHEFIADETAIENKNAEAFALMLLQSTYSKMIVSPAQSFHYSPIKRRLLMLTTSKKPSFSYARRLLILPLLTATVLLFAFKLKDDKKGNIVSHVNAPFVLVVDAGHGGTDDGAPGLDNKVEKNINLSIAKKIQELASGYGITIKMTRTDDITMNPQERLKVIVAEHVDAVVSIHVNNNEEKTTTKNDMEVFITRFENNSNYSKSRLLGSGIIKTLQPDFTTNNSLLQRTEKGIYIIDANPYPAVLIECGYMNNADNLKQLTNNVKVEQIARDVLQGVVAYANADKSTAAISSDTTGKTPLYIVDGKEISAEEMKKIDANNIESINVLKDSIAMKQYGEKGKDGVVLITMKKKNVSSVSTDSNYTITPSNAVEDKSIIYVDGKEITKKELNNFSPENIESMTVWKGEEAIKKYGEKGRNGVIEVRTKLSSKNKDSSSTDTIKSTSAEPK